jgi:hypothetical protein
LQKKSDNEEINKLYQPTLDRISVKNCKHYWGEIWFKDVVDTSQMVQELID